MAEYRQPTPSNAKISDSTVVSLTNPYGGSGGEEGALLNGLLALGYDPAFVRSLADADPNRRYLNDATTRALKAGISEDDVKKALAATRAAATGDPQGALKALGVNPNDLPPDSRQAYDAIANRQPLPFLDRGQQGASGVIAPVSTTTPGGPAATAPTGQEKTATPGSPHYLQQRGGEPADVAAAKQGIVPGPVTPAAPTQPSKADKSTGTLADGSLDPKASPEQIKAYISKNYGHEAYLYNNPEIYPLIQEAAKKGYDENWLQGKVSQTSYWQHTDLKGRAWDEQMSTDPAEGRRLIKGEIDDMKQWGARFGLSLDEDTWNMLGEKSLRMGWDANQKHQALSAEMSYSPGEGKADPQVVADLKKKAGDYYIPMSDRTISDWARQTMAADGNMDGFNSYLIQQAKSLYPSLTGALDRGVTVKQFADPYAQIAAKTLEIPEDQVDFTDPKWMKALVNPDPKTGDRTFMNMADWQTELKKNPIYGWDKTQNARGEAADLAQQIIHRFGGGV